jgi:hypothetical protein
MQHRSVRHAPLRAWWAPWRRRCRCGCRWYPCPDVVAPWTAPPVAESLRLRATWNMPTDRYARVGPDWPPLMTRGQRWRADRRQGPR